jgi:hypothetical protein
MHSFFINLKVHLGSVVFIYEFLKCIRVFQHFIFFCVRKLSTKQKQNRERESTVCVLLFYHILE